MEKAVTQESISTSPTRRQRTVLVIDPEPVLPELLGRALPSTEAFQVRRAASVQEAQELIEAERVDLAVVRSDRLEAAGLELMERLAAAKRPVKTVLATASPNLTEATAAMQAGVLDYLAIDNPETMDVNDVAQRIQGALMRQHRERQTLREIKRLKKLCKKLNRARLQVCEQVDVLCNDLVTAYQELAVQLQGAEQVQGFQQVIEDELDLEALLRKTLEHLIQRAGPTNAAIFLPSSMEEYSLGGYVNYDCTSDSADMLLQHLADVLAPRVAEFAGDEPLHLTQNDELERWIGEDAAWLADSHVLTFNAKASGEALAVGVLFRDQGQPFEPEAVEAIAHLAPMLGEHLEKVIKVHHRHLPDLEPDAEFASSDEGEDEDPFGFGGDHWKLGPKLDEADQGSIFDDVDPDLPGEVDEDDMPF